MCFVKAKDLASYKDDSRETCFEGHCYWKPFSLIFSSPAKEQGYRMRTVPSLHLQDVYGHSLGLLVAPLFLYNTWRAIPIWFALLFVVVSVSLSSVHLYVYVKNRELYGRMRAKSILWTRILFLLLSVSLSFFALPPKPTLFHVLMEMLIKSPVMTLLFTSLIHRVEFRKHVGIQAITFGLALIWIPSFCTKCSTDPLILDKFQEMGYCIDWIISFTLLNKDPNGMVYPCWMLSALTASVFGFVLPTLIIFMSEVASRAMFIRSKISHKFHFDLFNYTNDAIKVGSLAGMCLTGASWFLLQLIVKLLN